MSKVNNTINLARNKIENIDIPTSFTELKNIENKKVDIHIKVMQKAKH